MNKKNKIKIIVNGKQMTINLNFSVKNLIDKLKMPITKVAIELNREIVNKKNINKIKSYFNKKFKPYEIGYISQSKKKVEFC